MGSDWIGVLPVDSLCTPRMSIDLVHYRARLSAVIDSVENVTPAARHLALSMLRSNDEMLAFPRPDRDGDCGGAFMTRLHHEAWHVLKAVSDMCALLIRPRGGLALSQFETRRDLVDLRIQVFSRLPGGVSRTLSPAKAVEAGRCVKLWFNGRTGLAPRKQQERALMQLLYRVVDCRSRAHFLWMNMGAGKTFVSLLFGAALCALYGLRPGAMKVLFATAASAIETVVKDARQRAQSNSCGRAADLRLSRLLCNAFQCAHSRCVPFERGQSVADGRPDCAYWSTGASCSIDHCLLRHHWLDSEQSSRDGVPCALDGAVERLCAC